MALTCDGASFVQLAVHDGQGDNPLVQLASFTAFVADILDRCAAPPVNQDTEWSSTSAVLLKLVVDWVASRVTERSARGLQNSGPIRWSRPQVQKE